MANINANYLNLRSSYLFSEIASRVAAHAAKNPEQKIIRLGIGDVTQPLVPAVVKALQSAVAEQATAAGFKGYGPEQGYDFLREVIVRDCYADLGIKADEVFVSDGAKCDVGNFPELFAADCKVAITDPVYPVYADVNVMAGRGGAPDASGRFAGMIYLPCTAENNFVPDLPKERPDLIYLCYPNNPTGTVLTKDQLKVWVDYARKNDAVIFYDAAYECFIREPGIPHSIYEIEGAHEVAIEFRSYSKTAGFTGLRCGYAVVPKAVTGKGPDGSRVALNGLWNRRQTTKYNGCPYIVQRAAEAVHSAEGKKEVQAVVEGYLANSRMIKDAFVKMGLTVVGGVNAPYVWVKLPMNSWDFFSLLLEKVGVVGTPGAGFGPSGQEYFRLTGFGSPENTKEAIARLQTLKL
ncbi:LL-diaminopimelate aminotransferase [uncultured delta proteobacterium]|uniref:LL-diaminopimelate aminotransferase n=1 Tax=uncultured delta proteobacterium TaxID=34034 RepID=A0A212JVX2_9DELT|nr:LL-diaminopimelate aminotransferase [uncultured delta proteobacterium]